MVHSAKSIGKQAAVNLEDNWAIRRQIVAEKKMTISILDASKDRFALNFMKT